MASSSKVLSSAVEAKKSIIHKRADSNSGSRIAPCSAKLIQARVVSENISIEENTARCLRLIANSFLTTLMQR